MHPPLIGQKKAKQSFGIGAFLLGWTFSVSERDTLMGRIEKQARSVSTQNARWTVHQVGPSRLALTLQTWLSHGSHSDPEALEILSQWFAENKQDVNGKHGSQV